MRQSLDLHRVAPVEQTDDPLHDIAWLSRELADASSGRESDLMRMLLSRVTLNNMVQFSVLLDASGTMWDVNNAALRGAGLTRRDIHGKPFWEAPWWQNSPDAPHRLKEAIERAAQGEFTRYVGDIIGRANGQEVITIDLKIQPVRDCDGEVRFLICEGRDVTEQRHLERNAAIALQRTQEQLAQAQKMEGIGQLTGGVAHDFNNLLTVIMGNLETLQRALQNPQVEASRLMRSSQNAMRAAERAATLTQRLLAFSRRQSLDPKIVDVSSLVSGMSDLLRRSLGEQIAIETILERELWSVHVDANQLEVAILNLAINARDAMPEGGELTIATANTYLDETYALRQAEVLPGPYVVIAITDTGCGMTREIAAQAFEPFFTTKGVGHGTGLGLSQVYGFVKQSGGHIEIFTEVGQGTTVKIYLPRLNAAEESVAAPKRDLPPARSDASEIILVVEDDEDVRTYTKEILRELGYRTLEAGTGRAALQMLQAHPEIQLLFADVGLPGGMNGRQLAHEARLSRSDLKILLATGHARDATLRNDGLAPNVQLITKPFTYVALAAKLREIL